MKTFSYYDRVAHFTNDNVLIVEGEVVGEFKGLREAREYLESIRISESLKEDATEKSVLSFDSVAVALYENGEERITPTLVEGYKTLIEEKTFFPTNTVISLREQFNPSQVSNKMDYVLRDGSTVMLDIETNFKLNSIIDIKESRELLLHMTANKENFLSCVNELLGDY